MRSQLIALMVSVLALSACQSLQDYLPSVDETSSSATGGTTTRAGSSSSGQSAASLGPSPTQGAGFAADGEQTAAIFTAPIDDNPQQFMGLGDEAVIATLGDPDLTRRDGPAEIRQFRGQDCVLDLFMYPASGDLAVRHVELRGPSLTPAARRACLVDLIRDRALTG